MTPQIDPSPLPPNAVSVALDTPCRKCGYNLRGLALGGRCPECGTPIGLSVHGDLLRYSHPRFVDSLARGVSLTLWGILVIVVGSVFFGIAVAVAGQSIGTAVVVGIIPFAGYLMTVVGSWLLTVPDPSGLGEDRYGTARKIIRITLVIGIINQLIDWANRLYGTVPPAVHLALVTLGFTAGIVGLVGQFAELYYLHKLALRIPDVGLSQRAHFLMWAFGSSYAVFLVLGLVAALLGGPGGGLPALACVVLLALLAVLVFAIMYLFMLGRFGQQFRTLAALAGQSWPSAAPAA